MNDDGKTRLHDKQVLMMEIMQKIFLYFPQENQIQYSSLHTV